MEDPILRLEYNLVVESISMKKVFDYKLVGELEANNVSFFECTKNEDAKLGWNRELFPESTPLVENVTSTMIVDHVRKNFLRRI